MKRLLFINFTIFFLSFILSCNEESQDIHNFDLAIAKVKAEKLDQVSKPEEKLPFLTQTNLDPVWDAANPNIIKIPSFSLKNQDGRVINQEKLKGRITISCFFYTKCSGVCPHVMRNMKKIKSEFENDSEIYFLSFSVTPDMDTIDVMKKYATATGFGKKNWDLVTGRKAEIYKLARETFNADTDINEKKSEDDFIHSEQIYMTDGNLKIRAVYNGNVNGDIERIIKDIRKLKELK